MSQMLNTRKEELLETAYKGCETKKQFQNVYTSYLGAQFKLTKLPVILAKLQGLMNKKMEMPETPTDEEILEFAKTIENIAKTTNSLKNPNFSGLDFIAMTYVFADNQ